MAAMQKIRPCLWFATQAEEAASLYVSIFPDSRIVRTLHYGQAGHEVHGMPAGSVLLVEFGLDGQPVTRPQRRAPVHLQRGHLARSGLREPG